MKSKKGPLIFILVLLLILVFILGVQYGKSVQVADEVMKIIVSITPPTDKTQTKTTQEQYRKYYSQYCGISFIYPDNLILNEVASDQAELKSKSDESLVRLVCKNISTMTISNENSKNATQSVLLDNQKTTGRLNKDKATSSIEFEVKNPNNNFFINATIDLSILPLIENTFKFEL